MDANIDGDFYIESYEASYIGSSGNDSIPIDVLGVFAISPGASLANGYDKQMDFFWVRQMSQILKQSLILLQLLSQ